MRRTGTARWPTPPAGPSSPRARRSPRRARSRRTGTRRRSRCPGTTGSTQRFGLWVGSRPSKVAGVHRRATVGAGSRAGRCRTCPHDRHAVARRRLLARRRLPRRRAHARRGARGWCSPPSSAARSTPCPVRRRRRAPAPRPPTADLSLPFGGVPLGREGARPGGGLAGHRGVARVQGPHRRRYTSTMVQRLPATAGGVTVGPDDGQRVRRPQRQHHASSTASPHNPWQHGRRPRAARRAAAPRRWPAGLFPIATGGDGGGSIRIPAGFNGLVGMKGTAGRIPRGPAHDDRRRSPWCIGCLARSVRDVARWYDVCAGYDGRDPYSLPASRAGSATSARTTSPASGWRSRRPSASPSCAPRSRRRCGRRPRRSPRDAGLTVVDVRVRLPGLGVEWAMANLADAARRPRRPLARAARTTSRRRSPSASTFADPDV